MIANHVIEHLKELFWLFGNLSRVLKVGGIAIIGCPNLASWHNRAALLLGQQPPSAKMLGPHVRGITLLGFKSFIEYGGYFEVVRRKGSNFTFSQKARIVLWNACSHHSAHQCTLYFAAPRNRDLLLMFSMSRSLELMTRPIIVVVPRRRIINQ